VYHPSRSQTRQVVVRLPSEGPGIPPGMAFYFGDCPYCGHYPQRPCEVQAGKLYCCEECGFPVQAFLLLGVFELYEAELEPSIELIDSMLASREVEPSRHLIS
jgi:predicted RNA-binding Zn-ribbon protein involved in translation (DUF1610 family)